MNLVNIICFIILFICIAVVALAMVLVRKKAQNLDGMCGIEKGEAENLRITVESTSKKSGFTNK